MSAVIVLENIPFKLDFSRLKPESQFRPADGFSGAPDEPDELEPLIQSALAIGRPKAISREAAIREKGNDFVTIDALTFKSRILRANLEPVDRVYPFIVTGGWELEEWRRGFAGDDLQKYRADLIAEMALHSALQTLEDRLRSGFNLGAVAMMNPGSLADWPLEDQVKLFALLGDPQKAIGVRLTESYLMEPVKSISGIFFENADHYQNCRLCPRETCPARRAPYDPVLLAKVKTF